LADRQDLDPVDPADVAWSLAATRSVFEHRAVVTGTTREDLTAALAALAAGQPAPGVTTGVAPSSTKARVGFLFAGQGSQRAGMGRELHACSPVFAAAFDQACALLEAELGVPVAEVVLGDGTDDRADQTLYAQAGLFAVGAGLVALLAACGITPDAVAGHSVGEVTAAYAAGVLSLEDACRLVAARAGLMQALPADGAMTAIAASEAEVAMATAGVTGVSVAAVNGPSSVVISGDAEAVEHVAEQFRGNGRRVRGLRVSHAFHSHRMDTILDELSQVAAGLTHASPRVPWARGLSGELVTEPGSGYWPRQAREPVRFADAVTALAAQEISVFIEIGPDGTLSALGPAALGDGDADADFIPVLRPGQAAPAAVLAALARAHVRGAEVDWAAVLPAGRRTELPTYAFQRQRYWPQLSPGPAAGTAPADGSQAALFAVEWVPLPAQAPAGGPAEITTETSAETPAQAPVTGRWAVIGADRPGLARGLAEAGVPVRSYPDLAALAEAVGAGDTAPDGVLAWAGTAALDGAPDGARGGDDAAATARAAVARALDLVQQWLAEDRLAAARLVLVTRGAVAAVPDDDATDLAGASVWGLVRSAQA
ncbi:MAG TPA: acyltransferase domain-containing protein, partial [Streptosporangiaceae bacterium]